MNTYKTAEVAAIIGVHPNTVRLYEKLELLPKPRRLPNGYRVFTEFHIQQCKLIRLAFQIEVLQNGLRKKSHRRLWHLRHRILTQPSRSPKITSAKARQEHRNAEEAIDIVKQLLSGGIAENAQQLNRKEVSRLLDISMDTLRNWEMNGLLTVKRKANGYRVYTAEDIQRLKIIRSLRCAKYSLEAILRLLQQLSQNPDTDIRTALNTPRQTEDIISVCDHLMRSLSAAEANAVTILDMLRDMKAQFS